MEGSFPLDSDIERNASGHQEHQQKEKPNSSSTSGGTTTSTAPGLGGRIKLLTRHTHGAVEFNKSATPLAPAVRFGLDRRRHDVTSKLKQFFQLSPNHKHGTSGESSMGMSASKRPCTKSSSRTTPQYPPLQTPFQTPAAEILFLDEHGLEAKYGKFGKLLGSGLGGSVRVVNRRSDATTFAVKEFREILPWETEQEYLKKVIAEFYIGSRLNHGNIIETMDLVQEGDRWFEVMEYAPYDLFASVVSGNMSREEIACSFLQIVSGVSYLHSMGLAHRDLKLENVVVTRYGIMKLIDFGSAVISKTAFQNEVVLASGILGSYPYLAPEVFDEKRYNSQAADIWSLAIMFCCMTLRRFPWSQPRMTDSSYNFFASALTARSNLPHQPMSEPKVATESKTVQPSESNRDQHRLCHPGVEKDNSGGLKGSWCLLCCLPSESRHIIGRMLTIDPEARASMDEILADRWAKSAAVCTQVSRERVIHAPGHKHTLELAA